MLAAGLLLGACGGDGGAATVTSGARMAMHRDASMASAGPVAAGEREPFSPASIAPPRTTTTRAPRPPRASRGGARTGANYHGNPAGSIKGYPCGGDLPPCSVLKAESDGNPRAVNPTGCNGRGCYGLWQFDPRTWANFEGYARADQAPADVQNEKARRLWANGAGCSHWGVCG